MKELTKREDALREIAKTISLRMLSKTVAPEKEILRWTPFEGIPVSVSQNEIGHAERIAPA